MRSQRLLDALGKVEDRYIAEAAPGRKTAEIQENGKQRIRMQGAGMQGAGMQENGTQKSAKLVKARRPKYIYWGTAAACFLAVIGLGAYVLSNFGAGAGGGGSEPGSAYMSYEGPVLPLGMLEETEGLLAERELTFDFSPYETYVVTYDKGNGETGSYERYDTESAVKDEYVLYNTTEETISTTAVYAFAGRFGDAMKYLPKICVDGSEADVALYAGRYSGGFRSVYAPVTPKAAGEEELQAAHAEAQEAQKEPEEHTDRSNLNELGTWQEYAALLEEGTYREDAFAAYPVLDQDVIVYTLTDLAYDGPEEEASNPVMNLSFSVDPRETVIMTWGSDGGRHDPDGGNYHRHFDIPKEQERGYGEAYYLIVLGEDVRNLTMQAYSSGIYREGEELEDASCTLTRSEMKLGELLERIITKAREEKIGDQEEEEILNLLSDEMLLGSMAELLYDYGVLSEDTAERYDFGMLEDMYSEMLHMQRVMYLAFPVTIPAGGSVTVSAAMVKNASIDFIGEGVDRNGYDMMVDLGSNLTFTGQKAAIAGWKEIEILSQNFGFDPTNGITEVDLDLSEEHYYIEVKKKSAE